MLQLPGRHDAESVAEAMIREMSHLPIHLRRWMPIRAPEARLGTRPSIA